MTNIFNSVSVSQPEKNTMQYENGKNELGEMGCWAYIKEIPTTRVWGRDEEEAGYRLMLLIVMVNG